MTEVTELPGLPDRNRQVVLRRRPQGLPELDDFDLVEAPMPELAEGEALVRQDLLGIDASIRTWVSEAKSYFPPVAVGEVVRSAGAGAVVATRCATIELGQLVTTLGGWQEYTVVRDDVFITRVPAGTSLVATVSLFGSTGVTAFFGMTEIGRPEPGQTVVVSGAAGATGSVAGQIARNLGARVVGIAGGPEKCAWIVDELGFDAAVDHRSPDFGAELRAATPQRIDVYFDNVGGPVLDACLGRLAMGARVVLCGAISVYNEEHKPAGPANYLELITARARMEGFNAFDYWGRVDEALAQLHAWAGEGRLVHHETVLDGLERAPEALRLLFEGGNRGKLLVRLTPHAT